MLCATWDLPGLGIEPMSPALADGFLSIIPPRKSTKNKIDTRQIIRRERNKFCVRGGLIEVGPRELTKRQVLYFLDKKTRNL